MLPLIPDLLPDLFPDLSSIVPPLLGFEFTSPGRVLFNLGPLTVRWYGLLIAIAVLLGVTLTEYLGPKRGIHVETIGELPLWLVPSAVVGARIYYVAFQWQNYAQRPEQIIAIWEGGIAIHGAILGGILAAIVFAKVKQISFWQLGDTVVPALALGQAIGRWGNFFNSEAFGAPTDLPWKLKIPESIIENGRSIYLRPDGLQDVAYYHPTFLYESLWNLAVFGLLMWLSRQEFRHRLNLHPGTVFLLYLIAYSGGRIWIEALRTDSLMASGIKMAQVVSVIGIVVGLAGLWWLYGKRGSLPDVVARSKSKI
jgi:phosphatidylglycerol---prolipoprotein diacylglyceryl transferase